MVIMIKVVTELANGRGEKEEETEGGEREMYSYFSTLLQMEQ